MLVPSLDKIDGKKRATDYVSVNERWDWILSSLILDDMFVHEVLLLMDKSFSTKIKTMGVLIEHTRILLHVNEKFFDSLSDAEVRYVLKHECMHVVLHHCTLRLPEDPKEKDLWNIAADLAANSLIPENANCQMPMMKDPKTGKMVKSGCLPSTYKFPEKLSMEQYVQLLREKAKGGGGGQGKGQPQGGKVGQQPQGGQGKGKPQSGKGQGQQDPNGDPQDGQGQGDQPQPQGFDSHDGWNKSEVADDQIRQKIEQMANKSTSWGNTSADVKDLIIAAQRSKVAWHRILRDFFGHLLSSKSIHTFKRPNRRFGYPFSGLKRGYTDRKLVAIDTSGSVPDAALAQFLTECNRLADRCGTVDVCLFDCEITQMPKPFSRKHAKYEFKGRGGTAFDPICKLASEMGYQSLIILTDGYAPAPEKPEGVKHIIWCITPDGKCPVEWGTQIKIDAVNLD